MQRHGAINHDMLAWFAPEERHLCSVCGEHGRVSVEQATASFCLACGAVFIDEVRIDSEGRIETSRD